MYTPLLSYFPWGSGQVSMPGPIYVANAHLGKCAMGVQTLGVSPILKLNVLDVGGHLELCLSCSLHLLRR